MGDGGTLIDAEGINTVSFGAGLSQTALTVTQALSDDGQRYLDLDFGNGDRLSIRNGELDKVQTFRFADGTTLSTAELLASMPRVDLLGEAGAGVRQGYAGDDALAGQAGDDMLLGSIAVAPHRRRAQSKSRRWPHGERGPREANDTAWRRQA